MCKHMEVSEDLNITLRVGQSLLSITILREDEEAYRAAGQKISMMKAQEKLSTGNKEVHFSRFNWLARKVSASFS